MIQPLIKTFFGDSDTATDADAVKNFLFHKVVCAGSADAQNILNLINRTLLFLGGGNEPTSLEFVSKLLGKETVHTRTRGQTKGRSGSSSVNFQQTGRDLMTPDEIRMLPTNDALLFIRGEKPVRDKKYDIKKHPNVRRTADGRAKPYSHNPPVPDYTLPDLPYEFRTLDDYTFLEDEYENEET